MLVWFLEGDGAVLEELDQGGAADPEEVGRLLSREEQPLGGNKGGLALTHDIDHLTQDAVNLGWERYLLVVGAQEKAGLGVALDRAGHVEELVEVLGGGATSSWRPCPMATLGVPLPCWLAGVVPQHGISRKNRKRVDGARPWPCSAVGRRHRPSFG